MNENSGEIILYQPNNKIRLEVRMQEETVWLTQAQMGQLFDCSTDNISLHLKNLYAEGEIEFKATPEEISVVRQKLIAFNRMEAAADEILRLASEIDG